MTSNEPLMDKTVVEAPAPKKPRDAFWDNYRACCSIFVLVTHVGNIGYIFTGYKAMLSPLGRIWLTSMMYLNTFTMPGFCFVSGYLSKAELTKAQRINLVRYMVAYAFNHMIFLILVGKADRRMHEELWEDQHPNVTETNEALEAKSDPLLSPPGVFPLPWFRLVGVDWYLFIMIIWRSFLPIIAQFRRPLLTAVFLGVFVMFTDASWTVYSNTLFSFMPYYLLGFYAKDKLHIVEKIRDSMSVRVLYLVVAVAVHAWSALDPTLQFYRFISLPLGCLYGGEVGARIQRNVVHQMDVNTTEVDMRQVPPEMPLTYCTTPVGVAHVLTFYVLSTCGVLGLMSQVPTRSVMILTRARVNAIYIYFGQIWGLAIFKVIGMRLRRAGHIYSVPTAMLFSVICNCVLWYLTSHPWFTSTCRPCIEPQVDKGCCPVV